MSCNGCCPLLTGVLGENRYLGVEGTRSQNCRVSSFTNFTALREITHYKSTKHGRSVFCSFAGELLTGLSCDLWNFGRSTEEQQ